MDWHESSHHGELINSVVALFEASVSDPVRFLGSAFFASKNGILITVAHNLPRSVIVGSELSFAGQGSALQVARVVMVDPELDLALLTTGLKPPSWLNLAGDCEIPVLEDVACYEYSRTRSILNSSEQVTELVLSGRSGTVTRLMTKAELDGVVRNATDDMLEVSFPTLGGASGAPVVRRRDCLVIGVIAQSWTTFEERPAEIQEIIAEDVESSSNGWPWERLRVVDYRQYMVPQGIAINVRYVTEFVSRSGLYHGLCAD